MRYPTVGYLRDIRNAVLRRAPAGPGLTVLPDDVFLVSVMRSGNTWTRFLIANLTHPEEPATFLNVEERIPDIYQVPDSVLLRVRRPRLLKSHECFDPRYKRSIYIVRDPRDVIVSRYNWHVKWRTIPRDYPLSSYAPRFISGELQGRIKSGTWAEHVLSWLAMRAGDPGFLLIRYEDMKNAPQDELSRLASFLGLDSSPDALKRAIELSSAERMRQIEKEQSRKWGLTKRSRQDVPFVGKATSGGWKSALPAAVVAEIEEAWWPLMKLLGYELNSDLPARRAPAVNQEVCAALSVRLRIQVGSADSASGQPAGGARV